jgi:hypothetical protein
MSRPIIFVDFDRTLFQTDALFPLLWDTVGELYPQADIQTAKNEVGKWYEIIEGDYKHYLFPQHLLHVTGANFDQAEPLLLERLSKHDFTYPDVGVINHWPAKGYDVRILTFGGEPFQKFKLKLTPQFIEPRDIILEPKGTFLAHHYPDAAGFMVDDKRNPGMPATIKEVWLNRQGKTAEDAIITISSLEQLEEFL